MTSASKRPSAAKKGAERTRSAPSLAGALAEAAWAEADLALAEALSECDALDSAADDDDRRTTLALLAQALGRAARKRGLIRVGALGATIAFDPTAHDLASSVVKTPSTVRIAARGVARGAEVLLRPRVVPAPPRVGRRKSGQ